MAYRAAPFYEQLFLHQSRGTVYFLGGAEGHRFCLSISPQKVVLPACFSATFSSPMQWIWELTASIPSSHKFRIQGGHMAAGVVENKFSRPLDHSHDSEAGLKISLHIFGEIKRDLCVPKSSEK